LSEEYQKKVYDQYYSWRARLTREQIAHPMFAAWYERLAGYVLDAAPDTGARPVRILEVGCGEGLFAAALDRLVARRGAAVEYTGTDISRAAVELAGSVASGRFVTSDGNDVASTLAGERFDVVFAKNVLHHLDEPHRFLAQARRLLGTDGRAVFFETSRGSPLAWLAVSVEARREKHWFVRGKRRNRIAFARGGLQVLSEDAFSWLPFEIAYTTRFRIMRWLIPVRSRAWVERVARLDAWLARVSRPLAMYNVFVTAPTRTSLDAPAPTARSA